MNATCIGRHDTDPPLPEPGLLLCAHHLGKLRRDLADIAMYYPLLAEFLHPGNRADGGGKPGKPGSRPPCDVDILDILDERGVTHAQLVGWARILIEERRLSATPADAEQAVRLMQTHVEWIAAQPWVDEAMGEIHDAAHRIKRKCGEAGRVPIGQCRAVDPVDPSRDCGGPLYWTDGLVQVKCRRCHDTWEEADLLQLVNVVEVWVSVTDAATLLGVTVRTINRWAEAGLVKRKRGRVVYSEVVDHVRSSA